VENYDYLGVAKRMTDIVFSRMHQHGKTLQDAMLDAVKAGVIEAPRYPVKKEVETTPAVHPDEIISDNEFWNKGKHYVAKVGDGCSGCALEDSAGCYASIRPSCIKRHRSDNRQVIFVAAEDTPKPDQIINDHEFWYQGKHYVSKPQAGCEGCAFNDIICGDLRSDGKRPLCVENNAIFVEVKP
jgi:hypothetical protein